MSGVYKISIANPQTNMHAKCACQIGCQLQIIQLNSLPMPSATLSPCPFWCWCISRPCRKAELPRTHIAKLWAMQCMPGVPLDMPICCPSVLPSMQVASCYAWMLPKCFPRHVRRSSSALCGSILAKWNWHTGEKQSASEEKIQCLGRREAGGGNPCGLRLLTAAPVNLSLV